MQQIAILISLVISIPAVFAEGKKWTAPDLEVAIQGLNHVIEGGSWCDLKPEEARQLMLPLRPAWENSLKDLVKRSTLASQKKQALSCQSTCTCGLWLVVFDHQPGIKKDEIDRIRKQQKDSTPADRLACLKKRAELCKTLLPELKRLSEKEFKSEGAF